MTDLATAAPPSVVRPTSEVEPIGGLWLVLVTAACAFGALGLTRNPLLFLAMAAIASGSLMMGHASAGVDHDTRRSLRLLQTLGMVCCLTVMAGIFS